MKTINVTFEDEEFESLVEAKGPASWHDFVLAKVPRKVRAK